MCSSDLIADKLHNGRSIVKDLRISGDSTWSRFSGGKAGTLWYYRKLVEIFQTVSQSPMVAELKEIVDQMEQLSA